VDASKKPPPTKKKRGSYTNWFVPDLWPFIEQAVKQHPKSLYEALFSLQHIRKPGRVGSPFDNLTISTLKGWFENDVTRRFVLRKKYEEAIKLQSARSAAQDKGLQGILKDHTVAFQMIVDTLKRIRDSGQPLDSTITQTIIQGIISDIAPKLFERRTKSGFFSVSRRFARKFVRMHMGWTWRRSTTVASKLPADWESQGHDMAYRIATLVKTYDIPEELVINSDQTALHIRPSTDQTYDVRGVKDVKSLGKDDKCQITCTISSAASGDLLPL
jgi:hypothetical protein